MAAMYFASQLLSCYCWPDPFSSLRCYCWPDLFSSLRCVMESDPPPPSHSYLQARLSENAANSPTYVLLSVAWSHSTQECWAGCIYLSVKKADSVNCLVAGVRLLTGQEFSYLPEWPDVTGQHEREADHHHCLWLHGAYCCVYTQTYCVITELMLGKSSR
jgi:hypothetical protein